MVVVTLDDDWRGTERVKTGDLIISSPPTRNARQIPHSLWWFSIMLILILFEIRRRSDVLEVLKPDELIELVKEHNNIGTFHPALGNHCVFSRPYRCCINLWVCAIVDCTRSIVAEKLTRKASNERRLNRGSLPIWRNITLIIWECYAVTEYPYITRLPRGGLTGFRLPHLARTTTI